MTTALGYVVDLAGGFTEVCFGVTKQIGGERLGLQLVQRTVLKAGDTFVADPNRVHALGHILDGTVSLLVHKQGDSA